MERIAREAREFREQEAKRIAAEKEAARLAFERQKELELQLLQGDVSEKARRLSEKESVQRNKLLEEEKWLEMMKKAYIRGERHPRPEHMSEEEYLHHLATAENAMNTMQPDETAATSSTDEAHEAQAQRITGRSIITPADKQDSSSFYDATQSAASATVASWVPSGEDSDRYSQRSTSGSLPSQTSIDFFDTSETDGDLVAAETCFVAGHLDEADSMTAIPKGNEGENTPLQSNQNNGDNDDDFQSAQQQTPMVLASQQTVNYDVTQGQLQQNNPKCMVSRRTEYHDTFQQETEYPAADNSGAAGTSASSAGVEARALLEASQQGGENPALGEGGAEDFMPLPFYEASSESIMPRNSSSMPGLRKRSQKTQEQLDEEDLLHTHHRVQQATCEIPLQYTDAEGFRVLRDAQVRMSTSLPPSRVDGRWSGSLQGQSTLMPSSSSTSAASSSASGSVRLDYRANSWSMGSLGMVRGHGSDYSLITLGGSLIQKGSAVGLTLYHPSSFVPLQNLLSFGSDVFSFSFRHLFSKSRWIFESNVSRQQELSVALYNSKLVSRLQWCLRNPEQFCCRVDAHPKITEDREAHVFGEWSTKAENIGEGGGCWKVGVSLVQSLHSKMATVGLGVRLNSARGLEWIFSWNRGNASMQIPVIIVQGLQHVHPFQVLYFSMISTLIQEGIAEMWGWRSGQIQNYIESDEERDVAEREAATLSRVKARQEAELQASLMARQAKRKRRQEIEKEGLVILSAMYEVEGVDEKWDATIPLQFWVNKSSLTLPARTKGELLGFYELPWQEPTNQPSERSASLRPWWKVLWDELLDLPFSASSTEAHSHRRRGPSPTLTVRYEFQCKTYAITIQDEQGLILPHPQATAL